MFWKDSAVGKHALASALIVDRCQFNAFLISGLAPRPVQVGRDVTQTGALETGKETRNRKLLVWITNRSQSPRKEDDDI